MRRYICDPALELNGQTTLAFLRSVLKDEFRHILEKYGFDQPDESIWYPVQNISDLLQEIAELPNSMMDFVSLGIAVAENSKFTPEIERLSVPEFFALYEEFYPTRHRNGDPGTVEMALEDDKHLVITVDVPYPDDVYHDVTFTVAYDANQPRKEQGGDVTVIHVRLS